MDSPIQSLKYTDEATKQMLENVRKRKKKFDDSKRLHNILIMATLLSAFIYLYYFYFAILKQNADSFFAIFSSSVNNFTNMVLLFLTIMLYGTMNILKQQREKKEKEYHDLRCEIVDRSKDLWKKEEQWQNRHIVFEMMKQNYDINLYHEKK